MPKTVLVYQRANGKEPFTDWLNGLRDQKGWRAVDISAAKRYWKEHKAHS